MENNIILIKWVDSSLSPSKWELTEDIESMPPLICHTVGFITEETMDYITICESVNENQVMNRITIPKGCIKEQQLVTELGK